MDAALLARFWRKVDKNGPVPAHRPELGPCWLWTASLTRMGYGQFSIGPARNRQMRAAHRLAWEIKQGPIPESASHHGTCVLHACDTPACVNPSHLFLGTQKRNIGDMIAKGRRADMAGSRHPRAKLTESDVIQIRQRFAAGGTTRKALAAEYGVDPTLVGDIVRRTIWRHV